MACSLRPLHEPEIRAVGAIAVLIDELVRVADFRVGDFGAAVGRVEFSILPMILLKDPVGVAEVHHIPMARVEQDWLVLALEEIQSNLAGLPEGGVHDDVRKQLIGSEAGQPQRRFVIEFPFKLLPGLLHRDALFLCPLFGERIHFIIDGGLVALRAWPVLELQEVRHLRRLLVAVLHAIDSDVFLDLAAQLFDVFIVSIASFHGTRRQILDDEVPQSLVWIILEVLLPTHHARVVIGLSLERIEVFEELSGDVNLV